MDHFSLHFHFTFTSLTIDFGESYLVPRCRRPAGRGSTAMVVTTAGALRLLPKIERGLGAERARLGTFRGLGTPVKSEDWKRLVPTGWGPPASPIKGFGTERARLGTFRGIVTVCVRLHFLKSIKKLLFFSQKEKKNRSKIWSLAWKIKNRPT